MRFSSLPLCFPSFPSPQHNLARLLSLSPPFGSAAKSRKSMACKGERAKEPKTRLDDRGKKSLTKNLPARQSARQYKAFKEPKMQRRNSDTCQTCSWGKEIMVPFFSAPLWTLLSLLLRRGSWFYFRFLSYCRPPRRRRLGGGREASNLLTKAGGGRRGYGEGRGRQKQM